MMSRISGNRTNNSEQPNASVSSVSATATDLASAVTLNKQRKKRKKKKDKTLLTNEAMNCSCGKRIENSCNSVSTCSNCVPTTCVYCHFNDLAYRKNTVAEHSHHFQGNLYDLNIRKNSSVNYREPHKIENNENHVNVSADCSNHFQRQHRNASLNRRTEQLQRFAVYENLCEFCGFAIGNGAYHLRCDVSNRKIHAAKQDEQQSENIYENICESCHSLFDGEQCMNEICKRSQNSNVLQNVPITGEVINVLVKKPPIGANRQFGKQFSEFLGSFKQKLTSKTNETERKRPKIEIIHDTNEVFKTNQTFDLNEIVQLRNQTFSTKQKENTCNELINSKDEIVSEVPSKPIRVLRASNSDSNFLENYHLTPPHLQPPYSESIVSDTILYSNSYAPPSYEDAIQHNKYASVSPFKLRARIKSRIYDSTSASSFFTYDSSSVSTLPSHSIVAERKPSAILSLFDSDELLRQWLILLKQQTHEYTDDDRHFDCGSTKCLPSKMLNESATKLKWSIEHRNNTNDSDIISDSQTNLLRRIEVFKENLMEHKMHSKRNAIYIKDSVCDVSIDETLSPDTEAPDIGTANIQSSSLLPFWNRNEIDSAENSDEIVCKQSTNQLVPLVPGVRLYANIQHINHSFALEITSQYLQMLKTFYMEQVTLSTSLNHITLVCGDRRIHFVMKFLMSQPHNSLQCLNKLVQPTKYMDFQQITDLVHKMGRSKQLGEYDKSKAIKLSADHLTKGRKGRLENAFLMRSSNLLLRTPLRARHKRSIDDFEKRRHRAFNVGTRKVKTLNDFSLPSVTKDLSVAAKSLNDFTVEKTDCSSIVTSTIFDIDVQNGVGSEIKRNDSAKRNRENIYQSIWMFKTVGTGIDTIYDDDSLNIPDNCEYEADGISTRDGSEWEAAQGEFLFSNELIAPVQQSYVTLNSYEAQLSNGNEIIFHNLKKKPHYQTICVLYNTTNQKWNEIIYDYDGIATKFTENMDRGIIDERSESNNNAIRENRTNEVTRLEKQLTNFCNKPNFAINFDSVNAWKTMLRAVDYIDDEEDVVS